MSGVNFTGSRLYLEADGVNNMTSVFKDTSDADAADDQNFLHLYSEIARRENVASKEDHAIITASAIFNPQKTKSKANMESIANRYNE